MQAGPEEIAQAVERLRAGGLVAFPTETVYGLGADATNADAVARVFALKGRPAHNPLIIHVVDAAMAKRLVSNWPADATTLASKFWPGPLTIVLPSNGTICELATAGGPTVALRAPGHHLTLALLSALGSPLVGPSANPSGSISPTTAEHVRQSFTPDQCLVLDGGPCATGIESTVVDLTSTPPRVLRLGVISPKQISQALKKEVLAPGSDSTHAVAAANQRDELAPKRSPGLLARHYAPRTQAVLFETADWPAFSATLPERAVILAHSKLTVHSPRKHIEMPTEIGGYAARLYAALREADALGLDLIAIERPAGDDATTLAVLDRLRRAATA